MTLYLPTGATTAQISFNTPNLSTTHYLAIQSQASDEYWSWELTPVTSNNRYSEFVINITEAERTAHINAIYDYEVQDGSANIIETGLLKYITEEGGSTGTTPYQSNNENREAVTYYRPTY